MGWVGGEPGTLGWVGRGGGAPGWVGWGAGGLLRHMDKLEGH